MTNIAWHDLEGGDLSVELARFLGWSGDVVWIEGDPYMFPPGTVAGDDRGTDSLVPDYAQKLDPLLHDFAPLIHGNLSMSFDIKHGVSTHATAAAIGEHGVFVDTDLDVPPATVLGRAIGKSLSEAQEVQQVSVTS